MTRSIEALFRACRDCGSEAGFEQPPCAEDHGPDCPEWFCLECGSVLMVGPPIFVDGALSESEMPDRPADAA